MKRMLSLFLCFLLLVCTACSSKARTSENAENILDSSESTEVYDNQSHDDKTESTQVTANKPSEQSSANTEQTEEETEMKLYVQVGEKTFPATLESNTAVEAFVTMMQEAPVVIQMSDYAGFEKVGSLGTSLPASNTQTTTKAGDIVLYNGNQIVIFYGSNSWSYTRLGRIDDLSGWEEALGSSDVTVTFSIGE